ncbi:membrane protein [Virgisporangium aliadipatigenens]|uniref:Membrane protein n=1 Tax=Virgisporangium aliadipatigenens TaxID=741659 RepID=A0A8J4DTG4_9ACTN|nr:TIGR03943 family protein [Virgisporangium aliadipatigenens]GIJ49256.1 membrane protein [Virgisporangium aliadipatigenens]
MIRQAHAILMLLLGVTVLRTAFTDVYLRYVKEGLRPLLIGVGVVLIVAAAATFWYEWRRPAPENQPPPQEGHREPRVSWLLAVPVLALILVAPPALGAYTVDRAGSAIQQPAGFPALAAGDPVPLTVGDYAARAVYDHGRSLAGRTVKVTGFVTLGKGGEPMLARLTLSCCAGDAQPIKVGLEGKVPAGLRPNAWLEVTGAFSARRTADPINRAPIPYLAVTEAKPVPEPRNPYES